MVEWLRDVGMPAEYVNKLARMFQDIKVSEDLNQEFKDTNRGAHVAGERGREGESLVDTNRGAHVADERGRGNMLSVLMGVRLNMQS